MALEVLAQDAKGVEHEQSRVFIFEDLLHQHVLDKLNKTLVAGVLALR